MRFKKIIDVLSFSWPFIAAILAPIVAARLQEALKNGRRRWRWGSILVCSIAVGLILFFFVMPKPRGATVELDGHPTKAKDTLIFNGKVVNYNPYRIVVYFEKSSDPGKLHLIPFDVLISKWRIESEGSWEVKIPDIEDLKNVYFFLVKEQVPVQSHVPGPDKVICAHWTKWGF